MNYELESIALITTFAHYAQNKRLPLELFNSPDYVALNAADIYDFGQRVKETNAQAEQISVVEAEGRFVATIKLAGSLSMADLGKIRWIEIIEPTQEEQQLGLPSNDNLGFYYDDFEKARHILGAKGIRYWVEEDPVLAIKADYAEAGINAGFTISKMPIEAVVANDIESERAKVVKLAA